VIVRVNPTEWMNENEMLYWIENIWIKCAERLSNPQSLLVLDLFSAHIVNSVKM
ncbi:3563_t:CDS:1, partial [Funneliformis geosporum]